MRALLDTNVLFPTIMREILADVASAGLYQPFWTPKILDELIAVVGSKIGDEAADIARAEMALLKARFPEAVIGESTSLASGDPAACQTLAAISLPDEHDRHVIGSAIRAAADVIVTCNLRDFPVPVLASVGLRPVHPDNFLTELWARNPEPVVAAARAAHAKAVRLGATFSLARMLRRCRLPRLARVMAGTED